jgi:hypothetical protein
MLTMDQRMHMYRGKKRFIDHISKVFEDEYLMSNVERVDYEVYSKLSPDGHDTWYTEFAVVTFVGGGKSVRVISGNSNNTNFREIGKLIDGGYYDELEYYEKVKANSTLVEV